MGDWRQVFYDNYDSFKEDSWAESVDEFLEDSFSIEMSRADAKPGQSVLELGFGNGLFLDWCKENQYKAYGVETVPVLVEKARDRGHTAWLGSRPADAVPPDQQFDLIVAIDLFEHLTTDELLDLFEFCARSLKTGGRILARFPNGASPFSAPLQYGDATHVSVLTPKKIEQIANIHNFKLVRACNAARPRHGGKRPPWIRRLGYLARDIIGNVTALAFHGKKIPMDANVTVVLARKHFEPADIKKL